MTKHLLFIPFMALLATSCGEGHITTTPVVKNAPSVSLSKTKKELGTPAGATNPYFDFENHFSGGWSGDAFFRLDTGANVVSNQLPVYVPCWRISIATNQTNATLIFPLSASSYTSISPEDYIYNFRTNASGSWWTRYLNYEITPQQPLHFYGTFVYHPQTYNYDEGHEDGYQSGYAEGYDEGNSQGYQSGYEEGLNHGEEIGYSSGYSIGFQEGEATGQRLYQNGQYTGLTIFSRRTYLTQLATAISAGEKQHPADGFLDMVDTNANYTIHIKWAWDDTDKKTTFQDYGNTIIGELYWNAIKWGDWSTSWFGYYDAELHYFTSQRHYANLGVLETSFYPEVYICSTISGDPNLYFFGSGNAYQLGFADGQTYTIQASETYNNVFTIFTPAFRAVANFFNLNIGPFKIWYFFAIPLIVSLLILVLRLVKH